MGHRYPIVSIDFHEHAMINMMVSGMHMPWLFDFLM